MSLILATAYLLEKEKVSELNPSAAPAKSEILFAD